MKREFLLALCVVAGLAWFAGATAFAAEPAKTTSPAMAKPSQPGTAPASAPAPTLEPTTAGPAPSLTFKIAPRQTQCGVQSLEDCTLARTEALRGQAKELRKAAALQPDPKSGASADPASLDQFNQWAAARSGDADKLAGKGAAATTSEAQMQFNQQYLQLQSQLQQESRKFQALSNASKAKHDIAMNAIRNMK